MHFLINCFLYGSDAMDRILVVFLVMAPSAINYLFYLPTFRPIILKPWMTFKTPRVSAVVAGRLTFGDRVLRYLPFIVFPWFPVESCIYLSYFGVFGLIVLGGVFGSFRVFVHASDMPRIVTERMSDFSEDAR